MTKFEKVNGEYNDTSIKLIEANGEFPLVVSATSSSRDNVEFSMRTPDGEILKSKDFHYAAMNISVVEKFLPEIDSAILKKMAGIAEGRYGYASNQRAFFGGDAVLYINCYSPDWHQAQADAKLAALFN